MTTLVTGGGGFIGLNVVQRLLSLGEPVVALSLKPLHPVAMNVFAGLPGRLSVEIGDVCDVAFLRAVLDRHEVRRVLHAAAITAGAGVDPVRASTVLDVNVAGTNAVLVLAREAGIDRVVLTSSGAVYGDATFGSLPVTEETPPRPASLYAISKLASERLAAQARALGVDAIRARLTAIYGAWEHATGVRDTLSPPFQIAAAAARGDPVVVAEGGKRDWTPGPEIAAALVRLLMAERPRHDLYNLGCGRIWDPALVCRRLAEARPGWTWRRAAAGEAPSIAYNDALDRVRLSPPSPARFEAEFGPAFGQPEAGAAAYAEWAGAHPGMLAT